MTEVLDKTPVPVAQAFPPESLSQVANLEGIPVDLTVRTYTREGDVSLVGDFPKDILLKVNGGSVYIRGAVSGHVVADGDICVDGNVIGGTLFSRGGNITVGTVGLRSIVVARGGSVECNLMEGPERAFAWNKFHVKSKAFSAAIAANDIVVEGDMVSCNITSCGSVQAQRVLAGGRGPSVICLQKNLTCEHYGRPMEKEDADRNRKVTELRKTMSGIEASDQFMHRLIQNCYRTALYFLLSGTDNTALALRLQSKRTRVDNIRRVVSFGEGIVAYYKDVAASDESHDPGQLDKFLKEQEKSIELLKTDLASIPDEFGGGDKKFVLERLSEIHGMTRHVHKMMGLPGAETYLNGTFTERLDVTRKTIKDVEHDIKSTITALKIPQERIDLIEHSDNLEKLLQQTRDDAEREGAPSQQQRIKSPLLRLLVESAKRFGRTLKERNEELEDSRRQLEALRKALTEERIVLFGLPIPGICHVEASHFDAETVITASSIKKSGFDANVARVIQLEKPVTRTQKFTLQEELIERMA